MSYLKEIVALHLSVKRGEEATAAQPSPPEPYRKSAVLYTADLAGQKVNPHRPVRFHVNSPCLSAREMEARQSPRWRGEIVTRPKPTEKSSPPPLEEEEEEAREEESGAAAPDLRPVPVRALYLRARVTGQGVVFDALIPGLGEFGQIRPTRYAVRPILPAGSIGQWVKQNPRP